MEKDFTRLWHEHITLQADQQLPGATFQILTSFQGRARISYPAIVRLIYLGNSLCKTCIYDHGLDLCAISFRVGDWWKRHKAESRI